MADEQTKDVAVIPETVLKKRKRHENWGKDKSQRQSAIKAKRAEDQKLIFKRAEQYIKEYRAQERDFLRLKRSAKRKGGCCVEPEAKLLFVIRIRGINDMHPKTRKILNLLRLRQICTGVFLKVNKSTMDMLQAVQPYVTYGYPNLKSITELIHKRGFGKANEQRVPLTDNNIIEQALGQEGILCIEDLVHEIASVGPNFTKANNFLWPFKLNSPSGILKKNRNQWFQKRDAGNREDKINDLIGSMN